MIYIIALVYLIFFLIVAFLAFYVEKLIPKDETFLDLLLFSIILTGGLYIIFDSINYKYYFEVKNNTIIKHISEEFLWGLYKKEYNQKYKINKIYKD